MQLNARGDVSIVEIVVFTPLLLLAFLVCHRHGFKKSSGWIFLLILCLIRIVGAVCDLVTYSSPSTGLYIAVAILDSVGISPLLLATIGILARLIDVSSRPFLTDRHFRLLQLVVIAGMVLSIVGGTQANITPTGLEITTPTKIGIILYVAGFVLTTAVFFGALTRLSTVPKGEHRLAIGAAIGLPFIAVRLLFSVLAVFVHSSTFSVVGGSIGTYVGMALVEEFIVVVTYITLGWVLEKIQEGKEIQYEEVAGMVPKAMNVAEA